MWQSECKRGRNKWYIFIIESFCCMCFYCKEHQDEKILLSNHKIVSWLSIYTHTYNTLTYHVKVTESRQQNKSCNAFQNLGATFVDDASLKEKNRLLWQVYNTLQAKLNKHWKRPQTTIALNFISHLYYSRMIYSFILSMVYGT